MTPSSNKRASVKLMVRPSKGTLLSRIAVWLLIAGTSILAGSIVISGIRLIVDPYSENWLKSAFPSLGPTDASPVQTLEDIQEEVQARGLTLGTAVRWPVSNNRTDWIFPVLRRPNSCTLGEAQCATTVALRVYRPESGLNGESLYRLVNEITVQGPEEAFVTTPLLGTASQVASVDRPAAISKLTLFETPYDDRPWLMMEGRQKFGTTNIRYGQIFYYNPRSATVSTVLSWTSPADRAPYFVDLDGTGADEVVVDQTVGLEPKLQGYTFINNEPPQLKEISLLTSTYAEPPATSTYEKALQLGRSGVWSHALQMMKSARDTLGNDWTPAAEAQLNLIAAHAQVAHDQTERNWSSRRQQMLAYLIDGQWERALSDLENKPISYQRLLDQLKPDFNRLWRRVQAHLDIHPTDEAAQVWGALLVTARQNPEAAEDWLKEQTQPKSSQERFEELLVLAKGGPSVLDDLALGDPTGETAIEVAAPIAARYPRFIGQVQQLAEPGDNWQRFGDSQPELIADQAWYQVRVQMVRDSRGWLSMNGADLAGMGQNALPLLGLQNFSQLQVTAWNAEAQSIPASITVQGARLEGSQVVLLASGADIPGFGGSGLPSLAMTTNAAQWLGLGTPLTQFVQSQATWGTPVSTLTSSGTTEAYYPYLKATAMDVTGDSIPELMLRLDPNELPPELAAQFSSSSWPRTLILSATGEQIYNDFSRSQSVVALLPNAPAKPIGLLIHDGPNYRLEQLQ